MTCLRHWLTVSKPLSSEFERPSKDIVIVAHVCVNKCKEKGKEIVKSSIRTLVYPATFPFKMGEHIQSILQTQHVGEIQGRSYVQPNGLYAQAAST